MNKFDRIQALLLGIMLLIIILIIETWMIGSPLLENQSTQIEELQKQNQKLKAITLRRK